MTKATSSSQGDTAVAAPAKATSKRDDSKVGTALLNAKEAAVKTALAEIEKQYGAGAVMQMGSHASNKIETFFQRLAQPGPGARRRHSAQPHHRNLRTESSGKTTLALHAIAQAQKLGGRAAFIDAEHALDTSYAKKIGVDIDNLLVSQPDDGEQALEITETLVRSGGIDIIVIDSVAALTPRAEIEGLMGEPQMGLQARLMSQALRKLTAIVSKTNCSVIFINQMRMKIGVMFGNPETTTGGNALKFYASLRLDVRRIDKLTEKNDGEQEIVGNRTRVKVVKNKIAPPFRQAEFDILYAQGISREGDILDLGVKYGQLEKSGAFFRMGETTLGQGREAARMYLKQNPRVADKLDLEIRAAVKRLSEI